MLRPGRASAPVDTDERHAALDIRAAQRQWELLMNRPAERK